MKVASPPVVNRTGEGEAIWWLGALATIKVATPEMTVLEVLDPPGAEAPLHVHHREDEGFWILEGRATFEVGGQRIDAGPGDFLFGPRDVPHRYEAGPEGCRMLFIFTPGGFEGFVRATGTPALERELPPSDVEPDFEAVMANLERFGAEILE